MNEQPLAECSGHEEGNALGGAPPHPAPQYLPQGCGTWLNLLILLRGQGEMRLGVGWAGGGVMLEGPRGPGPGAPPWSP